MTGSEDAMTSDDDQELRLVTWKARAHAADEHLRDCPSLRVDNPMTFEQDDDGESVRLVAGLSCEHGLAESFEWSDWTFLDKLLEELADAEREQAEQKNLLGDDVMEGELTRLLGEFEDGDPFTVETFDQAVEDAVLPDAEDQQQEDTTELPAIDPDQPHVAHNVGIEPSSVHLVVGVAEVGLPCPVCKGSYLTVLPVIHVSNLGASTWGMIARCIRCDPVLPEVQMLVLGSVEQDVDDEQDEQDDQTEAERAEALQLETSTSWGDPGRNAQGL